jgi:class 3 adenylate cyclase
MPLRFKIALFVVLLTVIVTVGAGVFITHRMETSLRREIELRGEALARNLSANVEDPVSQGDDLYIARFATDAMANEGVVYAVVVDEEGAIVGYRDATHEEFTQFLGERYAPPAGVRPLGDREFFSQRYEAAEWGPLYDVAVPITLAGQKMIGEVHVGISQEPVTNAVFKTRVTIGAISAAALLAGLIGSFVLGGFITGPVARLTRGVRKLQQGDWAVRVRATTKDEVGLLTRAFNEMAQSLGEKELIKDAFSRYVSHQVAELILEAPDEYLSTLKGRRMDVTVLFADIRGFTPLSEKLAPEEVVALLNDYLTHMTEVIFRHEGTLDKFLGDGLMAVFGAPVSQSDCTLNAVRAALEMRTRLQDFNLARQIGGQAPVRVGIGINFGEAVVGNIGSRERMDYTVIGDTVNVAQRIQAGASSGQIVLAEDAYRRVAERVEARPLGRFQLKGRTRELELFEVVDLKECEKPA